MKKTFIFPFNVLSILVILVLVARTMGNIGQGSEKEVHLCMVIVNNQKPGKCVKADCVSTCKKHTQGKHRITTSCMATKCLCFVRCPSS
ncbi:hypothetical protein N665_0244s0005 [Sinapis alba]|nr:hypothetical protein N665_0244s0005 [Sinapis alba]